MNDEIINTIMRIYFHNVKGSVYHLFQSWFGLKLVSSDNLLPRPPAKITALVELSVLNILKARRKRTARLASNHNRIYTNDRYRQPIENRSRTLPFEQIFPISES